jgi:23S rRNA (cytosine1962-C5)-methyltransferase
LFARWVRRLGSQRVLNCYCYTGGFTVAALSGGAGHVTSVDSSAPALQRVHALVELNGFANERSACVDADVNAYLREACKPGAASTRSCSTRRSSLRPWRTPNVLRGRTRTSTGSP